jgi:hypothetical protein
MQVELAGRTGRKDRQKGQAGGIGRKNTPKEEQTG